MKNNKTYTIGSVRLTQLEGADVDSSQYSDGDSENTLLEIYKTKDSSIKISQALSSNPEWPIYYHISPYRKNVIDWYEFKPGAKILEIGAGAGAVTEALCENDVQVTALELTKRRAEINAYRNRNKKNLEIVIGNLEEYKPKSKFDYIVCVGVLEYAGMFINSENPYGDFVKYMGKMLTDNGILIIAIENRLGLKYLSGAREDHTGGFFDGINQYPHPKKVQTFGRVELKELVEKQGFKKTEFFFPYPDYKNPMLIYSEQYHPGKNTEFPIKALPTKGFDADKRNRVHLFSEQLAMISLEKNKLYKDISNSFILVASKSDTVKQSVGFYTNTPLRKLKYQLSTYLKTNSTGELKFYKEAKNTEATEHLKTIEKNYTQLNKIFGKSEINIVPARRLSKNILEFDYINGTTLERILFESIVSGDYKKAEKMIDNFIKVVNILPGRSTTNRYLIDLNFDNIMIDSSGKWHFIDYEWLLDKEVPKKIIVQRSLLYLINRYSHSFKFLSKRGDYLSIAEDWYIPRSIHEKYSEYFEDIEQLVEEEQKFQELVNGHVSQHPVTTKKIFNEIKKDSVYGGYIEDCFNSRLNMGNKMNELENKLISCKQINEALQQSLKEQKEQTRKAELSSPYYLSKKVIRRVVRKLKKDLK